MIWRSTSLLLAVVLTGCNANDEAPSGQLPPPSAVRESGKAMVTTHGYLHPDDPPGTWRARRPHSKHFEPCSDWESGGPALTDERVRAPKGPGTIYLSWTEPTRPGFDALTVSRLQSVFGPPYPATTSVVVGDAAPLGPHWVWTLPGKPGPTFIAEALDDGSLRYHFAEIGRVGGGGSGAAFMAECLVERYGAPRD